MNIIEAKKLAKDTATENRLFGWKIFFSDTDKVCGICWNKSRTLEFSKPFFDLNSPVQCKDTILHEIAHALVLNNFQPHGHDRTWKQKCLEIGAVPNEFLDIDSCGARVPWVANDSFEAFRVQYFLQFEYKCRVEEFDSINIENDASVKLLGDGK